MIVLLPMVFALCSLCPLVLAWQFSRSSESSHRVVPVGAPRSRPVAEVLGRASAREVTLTISSIVVAIWLSVAAVALTATDAMTILIPGLFGGTPISSVAALIWGLLILLFGTLWCLIALLILVRTTRHAIRGARPALGTDEQSRLSQS